MNDIPFTYEIISVDAPNRCMEVVYSSPGRQTMHVSTRLPLIGEQLEDMIRLFAPIEFWRELDTNVVVPVVGTSGAISGPPPEPELTPEEKLQAEKRRKLALIAAERYNREVGGYVLPNGTQLGTDRADQAKLAGAVAAIQAGFLPVTDWKFADGVFMTLTSEQVLNIARLVTQHVQESFTWEKLMTDRVLAAETLEEVQAIEV